MALIDDLVARLQALGFAPGEATNEGVATVVAEPGPTRTAIDARVTGVGDTRYAPVSPTTGITYNPDGSVATVTENGVTTTYTYNSNGTVATDVRAGVTRTYTYDGSGNLTGIAS